MARGRRGRQRGRPVTGILLLDKPTGVSSNAALQDVKRLYKARKAGHTGSLDPLASGLLPICFGEATKMSAYLLDADKTYELSAQFGRATDTADADGEVIKTDLDSAPDEDSIKAVLPDFVGDTEQVPPMYSALHHNGKRLYELAREGIEVERPPRPITIYSLELLSWSVCDDGGTTADLRVHCSKGTYVRTLVEDIAKAAGSIGHVTRLRRVAVGPFPGERMVTSSVLTEHLASGDLEALDALLLPPESAIKHWPTVELDSELAGYIRQGNPVMVPRAPDGFLQLLDETGQLIGVGELDENGLVAPRRLLKTAQAGH